jgi:hypothetical protein
LLSLTTEIEKTKRGLSLEKRCWFNPNWNTIRLLDHTYKRAKEEEFWPITGGMFVVTQILTHLLDKIFENPKIVKNNENPKKKNFNIFASFLAFSTSSKKEFKFSRLFGTRSTFHPSFLKSLIFLIESTLILLVFKKYKKIKKNQNLQKKKVEGPILRPKQHFAYK